MFTLQSAILISVTLHWTPYVPKINWPQLRLNAMKWKCQPTSIPALSTLPYIIYGGNEHLTYLTWSPWQPWLHSICNPRNTVFSDTITSTKATTPPPYSWAPFIFQGWLVFPFILCFSLPQTSLASLGEEEGGVALGDAALWLVIVNWWRHREQITAWVLFLSPDQLLWCKQMTPVKS